MVEVMHSVENTSKFESILTSHLRRYVSVSCREDREGNLVCSISAKNIRRPEAPRALKIHISKSDTGNEGYVHALADKAVRDFIYPLSF